MPKLPKKLIPYAETLDLYFQKQLVKVEFLQPESFKTFSKQFNFKQFLKNGLPAMDDIYTYFGYFEIKNDHVFLPSYFYDYWLEKKLVIKTLKIELADFESSDELVFVQLSSESEVLNTFVFLNPKYVRSSFQSAFESVRVAKEKEAEIRQILDK